MVTPTINAELILKTVAGNGSGGIAGGIVGGGSQEDKRVKRALIDGQETLSKFVRPLIAGILGAGGLAELLGGVFSLAGLGAAFVSALTVAAPLIAAAILAGLLQQREQDKTLESRTRDITGDPTIGPIGQGIDKVGKDFANAINIASSTALKPVSVFISDLFEQLGAFAGPFEKTSRIIEDAKEREEERLAILARLNAGTGTANDLVKSLNNEFSDMSFLLGEHNILQVDRINIQDKLNENAIKENELLIEQTQLQKFLAQAQLATKNSTTEVTAALVASSKVLKSLGFTGNRSEKSRQRAESQGFQRRAGGGFKFAPVIERNKNGAYKVVQTRILG